MKRYSKMDTKSLQKVIIINAIITALTRTLPFLFFRKRKQTKFLKVSEGFPCNDNVLLVFYCLKDVAWGTIP